MFGKAKKGKERKYDIISFGSSTIDTFADTFDRKHLSKAQKKMRYEHIISYPTGSKILINSLNTSIGGGGTNTAATFSKFGLKTAYCGAIGNDTNSILIKQYLDDAGIDFIGHKVKDMTGTSVVLDSIEHDRTILTYKGANNKLSFSKIDKELLDAKTFYFSSLMGESFKTCVKLMKFASKNDIKVAFNPSLYQAKLGYEKLKTALELTNYLILNKEEAQALLRNETPNVKTLLLELKEIVCKEESLVLITDGKKGAYLFDGQNFLHAGSRDVKVIESTGAGDAFASGFISAIIKGEDLSRSLLMGVANSESVIMNKGAKEIIINYIQAIKYANKNKKLIKRV